MKKKQNIVKFSFEQEENKTNYFVCQSKTGFHLFFGLFICSSDKTKVSIYGNNFG